MLEALGGRWCTVATLPYSRPWVKYFIGFLGKKAGWSLASHFMVEYEYVEDTGRPTDIFLLLGMSVVMTTVIEGAEYRETFAVAIT